MAAKPQKETKDKFWLYAFRDHLANIVAYSNCLETADVSGDGDYRLLIADGSKMLKVYGGTSFQSESPLYNVPSAIASFYMETTDAFNRPVVAVAIGPYIFMYRNNRPLYRFVIPLIPVDAGEREIWAALCAGELTLDDCVRRLEAKLDEGVAVTSRTLDLLLASDPAEREAYVKTVKDTPLRQYDVVTCMESIYLDHAEEGARGCLVIGTEHELLYVLRNNANDVALKVKLPSAPVFLIVAGCFSVDYRIIVSCRDGRIYSVKNGAIHSSVIQPDAQPSAVARYNSLIAVATTSNTLTYYNLKGKRQHNIFLPTTVTNMTTITDSVTGVAKGLIVALGNGEIRVYVGKKLKHVSQAYGTVTAMRYGRYGREDAALILVLQNGSLVVELLHRNADLSPDAQIEFGPPPEQNVPIPVPKLSAMFTAQREQEKKYGVDMYRTFQHDLCHLQLQTAKAYLSMISNGAVAEVVRSSAALAESSLRIVASVQGLGPVFKVKVTLQNVGEAALRDLTVVFLYASDMYSMPQTVFHVPYLVPSLNYPVEALVQLAEGETKGEGIGVFVVDAVRDKPLASTLVDLPEADLLEGL